MSRSISTKAGSKNDPADATGLAHYLEHLLFKGTDQYGTLDYAKEKLLEFFHTHSLKGFGIEKEELGTIAAGAIIHYLNDNQQKNLAHITKIYPFNDSEFVWLDPFNKKTGE